jgi:hypothetical protein
LDFDLTWPLGLSVAVVFSLLVFLVARNAAWLGPHRRQLLFAVAAFLAFATSIPVALTGLFFFGFGAIGYCEDAGYCAPRWWIVLGLVFFVAVVGLVYLATKGIQGYRRTKRGY